MSAAERIAAYLRQRGEPVSSHALAERFLRMSVGSEELATALLRPILEPEGLAYAAGAGWLPAPPAAAAAARAALRVVGAAVDRRTGRAALACGDGPEPETLEGCTIVLLDPARDAAALRVWLRSRALGTPAAIVSLRAAVRGAARIPRGAHLSDFCAALGVRWLEGEDAAQAARAVAACAREGAARREPSGPQAPAPPALPPGIPREQIAELPEAPGVYRFFDADGALIYVGKAANLRRRVASYFSASARRRPRRFYARIHRLEHEVAGSELEALLREARLIQTAAPRGNVQTRVRERGGSYGAARSWAILLPRADRRVVDAILTRDGRYLGRVAIGPRGGGLGKAARLLARAVRPGQARAPAGAPVDRDSEILKSWLARHGESASRLELDGFARVADARRALRRAARHLRDDPGSAIFR